MPFLSVRWRTQKSFAVRGLDWALVRGGKAGLVALGIVARRIAGVRFSMVPRQRERAAVPFERGSTRGYPSQN